MFGHNDNRSSGRGSVASDGILSKDDTQAAAAVLVGDMTTKYPPTDLPTPTSAPAAPLDNGLGLGGFGSGVASSAPLGGGQIGGTPVVSPASTTLTQVGHPNELLDIKQQALQHLSPLVDHLEQSASDRFRTTMMMIQASDNAALIKTAYDAALQIGDDKERAQALLDLINEINYFTQKSNSSSEA